MQPLGVLVSRNDSNTELEAYIFYSTVGLLDTIVRKGLLITYTTALLINIMQTFWKNKLIDTFLTYIVQAYSDGNFELNQVSFHEHIISCYKFNKRYSFIRNPNRFIVFVFVVHIQVLLLIASKTLFVRQNTSVSDCSSFYFPYKVLTCAHNRDPCQSNGTDGIPQCTYYYFELSNIITMVTSMVTWHYALRYFIVKLICTIRWILFRDDDYPRMFLSCYSNKISVIHCTIYFCYCILWVYLFISSLFGFLGSSNLFGVATYFSGNVWAPVLLTIDRMGFLTTAVIPELLEYWLHSTDKGALLDAYHSKGFVFSNLKVVTCLTGKDFASSASETTGNNCPPSQ